MNLDSFDENERKLAMVAKSTASKRPASLQLRIVTQLTRGIDPMSFYCWADVGDGGSALKQHWVNASCLLGKPSQ